MITAIKQGTAALAAWGLGAALLLPSPPPAVRADAPAVMVDADHRALVSGADLSNESVWGARDTDEDLSAMRGVFGAAVRASELLDLDAGAREAWREILDSLPPLPTSDHPQALRPEDYRGPRVFVRGLRPAARWGGFLPDPNSLPAFFFDLLNPDSPDRERLGTAQATFAARFRDGITEATPVGVLSELDLPR